ncbi:MAG: acetoacetate--CoA ligase [Actinomycetota bacterium]|nr:acetoacetate--CoA ligase [Actinomycetota bacterium]
MTTPVWQPSEARAASTQLADFQLQAGVAGEYADLHRWSVEDPGRFWSAVWDWCGVVGDRGEGLPVIYGNHLSDTRFFADSSFNFAENLLTSGSDDDPALLFRGENGRTADLSWAELRVLVTRLQGALRDAGVTSGDRIAAWLPNVPETYAVMLAAVSLGAVFSSTSPDFGVGGVVDRFGQIKPVVLFATDCYHYAGKRIDLTSRLVEVAERLPTVRRVVLVPEADEGTVRGPIPEQAVTLDEFLADQPVGQPEFVPLPFDHPLYILYSSGTTGTPKCIIHRAGGILLKHLTEHRLHCDLRPSDRMFYFTTAGWMMWNWLASGLASDATLVLYDGSPFHPGPDRLFDLVDDCAVTLFGISSKFVDTVRKSGIRPADTHYLNSLRTICSTGGPLSEEGFQHIYADWKADVHLASISGGTDLCGCLVGGNPTGPVHAGQIQGPALGMAVEVYDPDGQPLGAGQPGELVCTSPFPSMPLGFWDDEDGRYHSTYFERFSGAWHQGDFTEWTPEGGLIIHGRSDATLNPGGVRIGTAEIYRPVEQLEEIAECLAIGQDWEGDTRIVLFVVTAGTLELDKDLVERIRSATRAQASPRHVPAVVLAVPELPRTRSGKLVELAVRDVVAGRAVINLEALVNPETLDYFRNRPELTLQSPST